METLQGEMYLMEGSVGSVATRTRYPVRQRVFDVALTLLALPFLLLVGALIAAMVFVDSPGGIFYRQERVGRGGRPFWILKFRTMRRDATGPLVSVEPDERCTPLGLFLTRNRLDELPQVWNVLKGDMRLVGPRPELAEFVAAQRQEYEQILSVPPGLTGPTQLEFADEGKRLVDLPDREGTYREQFLPHKVRIDMAYASTHSLRIDLAVLLRTALLPLRLVEARVATLMSLRSDVPARQVFSIAVFAVVLAGVFVAQAAAGR